MKFEKEFVDPITGEKMSAIKMDQEDLEIFDLNQLYELIDIQIEYENFEGAQLIKKEIDKRKQTLMN